MVFSTSEIREPQETVLGDPRLDSEGWVVREAKLMEAGDYPDKGVSITPDILATLGRSFKGPVPILIEHAESPFELGYLTAVEHRGRELFGTVALAPEADALVERSGARGLSLGLSPELDTIREVSLVRNPRVADARLFFVGELESPNNSEWKSRFAKLRNDVRRERARREVSDLVSEGKVCPAQAPFAEALLSCEGCVAFRGESAPVARLFRAFLEAQPASSWHGEFAPESTHAAAAHLMLPEEAAFYQRYFPDVSLEHIAARRTA